MEEVRSVTAGPRRGSAPARSAEGDAFSLLAFQILRLSALLTAAGDAMAAPAGQTSARWQVLAAIETEPATVAQIARNLGLARQSVQRIADVLARDGAAAYAENPKHRRASLLEITAQGLRALREIQRVQRGWAERIGREIGVTELRRASALAERLMDAISSQIPEE